MTQFGIKLAAAVCVVIASTLMVIGRAAAAHPIRLAFVGTDSNIYECRGDCAKPQCLTCPVEGTEARSRVIRPVALSRAREPASAAYEWPCYSPDGKKLAYISVGGVAARPSFSIDVYDLEQKIASKIFESSTERGIYIFWLDGKRLSFLVTEPDGRLSLMLAEVREGAPVRIVATGAPLYFDWNRKTGELLIHVNARGTGRKERLSLMSLTPTDQNVERELTSGSAPFKTPCWSPDGRHLAFVAIEHDVAHLYLSDPAGANPKPMAKLMVGESSFVWAPDSSHIAFSTAQLPPHTVMDGITLLNVSDGHIKRIVNEDVAAFYFSPDSTRIAYVGVPPEQPFYTWNVIDLKSGKKRKLGSFLGTNEETIAWHYFEQLSLSHRIWAPDSSAIVFAGVPLTKLPAEDVPGTAIHAPPPIVTVIPIDGKAPREIAEGVLAFWAPAPEK